MATRVEEAYSERDQTINAKGEVTEIEIPYLVFEAADEDAALAAARTKAASRTVSGMVLDELEVTERVNKDTWKVKAIYKDEDSDDPADLFLLQRMKHDGLINTVQKFRPEKPLDLVHDIFLHFNVSF